MTNQTQMRQPRTLLLTGWLLLLFSVGLVVGGCQGTDRSSTASAGASEESRFGFLQVALTDGPLEDQGVTAVNICIERVDVLFADDQPRGTIPVSRTINLLDLRDGVTTALGISQFPVGVIHQVRLILCPDGATVVANGEELPLKVPGGEQTGIKLNSPGGFEIRENVTTTIVIDFDAERSIHYAPGQGWMLTPVVQFVEKAIVLAVTWPLPNQVVPLTLTVRGTIASQLPAVVAANDVVAAQADLDWHATIVLAEGPATIAVRAQDAAGRSATVTVPVLARTKDAFLSELRDATELTLPSGERIEMVRWRGRADGSLAYVFGAGLASQCAATVPITAAAAVDLVNCFIEASPVLF